MLTAEQNERLTRVGPGTPMGELMRRYWQPFLPVAKLDEDPVQRVRLLGEDLVCYRDLSGRFGLVGRRCAHRLVSLEFGIPDEAGLRCPYHGWCYDASGQCVDTPLEPEHSHLADRVRIAGYPVQEMGGLLFAYMGPLPAPVLPPWDVFVWPNAIRQIGYTMIPCNWLQCQENAADPVHSVYLHGHYFRYVLEREGLLAERAADPETHRAFASIRSGQGFDRVISKVDDYGLQKAMVYRKDLGAERDREAWHSYMIFPNYTRPGGGAVRHELQIRVPVDDTTTMHILYDIYVAPEGVEAPVQAQVPCYEVPMVDPSGKPILDYVLAQDMVAWWSQGPIADRTQERLGSTDEAIRRFRRLLEEQMEIVESGGDPMNVFRDPAEVGDIIHLRPRIDERRDDTGLVGYRSMYHRGYFQDDADRYGPALALVIELMARAEQEQSDKQEAAAAPSQSRGVTADV